MAHHGSVLPATGVEGMIIVSESVSVCQWWGHRQWHGHLRVKPAVWGYATALAFEIGLWVSVGLNNVLAGNIRKARKRGARWAAAIYLKLSCIESINVARQRACAGLPAHIDLRRLRRNGRARLIVAERLHRVRRMHRGLGSCNACCESERGKRKWCDFHSVIFRLR